MGQRRFHRERWNVTCDCFLIHHQCHFVGMEELLKGQEILLRLIPKLESGYDRVSSVIEDGGITTVADLEVYWFVLS